MSTPETRRQLSIPLLGSLLLNALLIGILATHWFHADDRRDGHRMPDGLPSIHGLSRELDADSRADLRQRFGEHRDAIRKAMREARESRRHVADALQAEPFSSDALANAFEKQRQADMTVAAAIQDVLVDFANARPATDRKALLRAMSRDGRERGERRPSRRDAAKPTEPEPTANNRSGSDRVQADRSGSDHD